MLGATGVLKNEKEVLTKTTKEFRRSKKTFDKPVLIHTQKEADKS